MTLMLDRRPAQVRIAEFLRGAVTRRTFRPPALDPRTPVALWCRNSWATVEVVGERAHFAALLAVVGDDHRSTGSEHHRTATLVPEPDNPFDPHAVAVHIDAQRVGYLSRDDAARYYDPVTQMSVSGLTPTVDARIWASDYHEWNEDGETTSTRFGAGVRLALDEPHLLLPVNSAPTGDHVLLPHGSAIQVHDSAAHLGRLSGLTADRGAAWAYATLHHFREQLPRSTREIVEVRVDGARIGKLTPKMSGDVLPAVQFLDRHSAVAAARLFVSGNRAAATASLYVVRAHELDDSWFDEVIPAAAIPD